MLELTEFATATHALLDGGRTRRDVTGLSLDVTQKGALNLAHFRPRLSTSYFENARRLRLVEPVIAARLAGIRQSYLAAESFYERLDRADESGRSSSAARYDPDEIAAMLTSAGTLSRAVANEAAEAALELERLFASHGAAFRRLKLKVPYFQRRRIAQFRHRGSNGSKNDIERGGGLPASDVAAPNNGL